jgi:hypothetical protein
MSRRGFTDRVRMMDKEHITGTERTYQRYKEVLEKPRRRTVEKAKNHIHDEFIEPKIIELTKRYAEGRDLWSGKSLEECESVQIVTHCLK